jgi:dynein heavy chain 2, cytosolic
MSRHSDDIVACFHTSNDLFVKLERALEQYQEWSVLGQVDLDQLVQTNLHDVADWEKNFRLLKVRGQDAEKLPR